MVETDWEQVGVDVTMLERLRTAVDGFVIGIANEATGERLTRVKLYKTGGKVDLSAFMPLLESLGLRAVEEVPIAVQGEGKVYIHDFGVLDARGAVLNLEAESDLVREALTAMWRGETEVDSLNRLVIFSGLSWHQVQILRAYRKYRMRVSTRFTEEYRNDALAENPHLVAAPRGAVRGEVRPDPEYDARGDRGMPAAAQGWPAERVARSTRTRSSARSLGTIMATVRTNAYLSDRPALSFKIRSADVPEMPKPFPLFEIFVYSPQMEAIHLRGGLVARGGIRWSDRKEDYRTEVLGLMKAQKVKNAVIVPDGSKGGFILKRSVSRDELAQEVVTQYVTFMRGLLDITDNLVDGRVDHPEACACSTATIPTWSSRPTRAPPRSPTSPTGSPRSTASGWATRSRRAAAPGYDHKALGITARGAWESVKRHFREIGVDVLRHTFTCVGIGDMSGDVFGNGLLYTNQVQARRGLRPPQHLHRPRSRPGVVVRRAQAPVRCCPGSSWNDYDRSLLSPGGVVLDRKAKWVTPSKEARVALGMPDDAPAEMTPNQLIALDPAGAGRPAVERRDRDVREGDARDARRTSGDRTNDLVRVNGSAASARRSSARAATSASPSAGGSSTRARAGGSTPTSSTTRPASTRPTTRSTGRSCSGLAIQRGELTIEERNDLLQDCAPDVVQHVLYDNYLQAQILSQEEGVSCAADRGLRGADAAARGRGRARARGGVHADDRRDGGAPRRRPGA